MSRSIRRLAVSAVLGFGPAEVALAQEPAVARPQTPAWRPADAAVPAVPASEAAPPAAAPPCAVCEPVPFDFKTVPPALRPQPRTGFFQVPPTGPATTRSSTW